MVLTTVGWPDLLPGPSASFAAGAAVVAGAAALGGEGWWTLLGPGGVVLFVVGLWRGHRRLVGGGGAFLIGAALVSGFTEIEPGRLLVAVGASFVAWDLGEHALTLDAQLGRGAATWRLEFLHVAVVTGVATTGVGLVSLLFGFARGGQPVLAVVLLLVGAMALLASLRNR